jgi:hypothetical protein
MKLMKLSGNGLDLGKREKMRKNERGGEENVCKKKSRTRILW